VDPAILWWLLAALLVLAGLLGLLLPALPGAPLVFAGLFLAAWAEDFAYVGKGTLILIGGLALLTVPADLLASAFGARRFGASRRAAIGAAVGALVGLFFGLPGILLGPFVGALIVELGSRRGPREAVRSGIGATFGLALGIAAKIALGFAMIGVFLAARLF
jgi:uncharacterized protein